MTKAYVYAETKRGGYILCKSPNLPPSYYLNWFANKNAGLIIFDRGTVSPKDCRKLWIEEY